MAVNPLVSLYNSSISKSKILGNDITLFKNIVNNSTFVFRGGTIGTAALIQSKELLNKNYLAFNEKTGDYEVKKVSDTARDLRDNISEIVNF